MTESEIITRYNELNKLSFIALSEVGNWFWNLTDTIYIYRFNVSRNVYQWNTTTDNNPAAPYSYLKQDPIPLDVVLMNVPKHIQIQLLFNLDLFR